MTRPDIPCKIFSENDDSVYVSENICGILERLVLKYPSSNIPVVNIDVSSLDLSPPISNLYIKLTNYLVLSSKNYIFYIILKDTPFRLVFNYLFSAIGSRSIYL